MVEGVNSPAATPSIAYMSQVAQASMYLNNVMSQAMLLKSKLGYIPLMELGTSRTLNLMG